MKIAIVSPFEETVPPEKYGGTELIVANVTEALVARGHDVTLFASGDSRTKAKLVPVIPEALRKDPAMQDSKLREAVKYIEIVELSQHLINSKFDIIHNHIGWRLLALQEFLQAPMVTTLHGPLNVPYQQYVYSRYPDSPFVSISHSQRTPLPDLNYIATVYNGIETQKFTYEAESDNYLAFLGRMSPEKGPVQAIQIAKRSGKKLIMAAKVDAVDNAYFRNEIKPLIDGEQIQFIGEVDHAGKVALLSRAQALLAPIQWEEPFGLFMVESLACGTPVIAIPRGSVPELIDNGKTGIYIENTPESGAEAVRRIHEIDRAVCRETAVRRFDVTRMVDGYEGVYHQLTARTSRRSLRNLTRNSAL